MAFPYHIACCRTLGHRRTEITIITDGSQAVEAVEGHSFDLILMDLHMPEIDGAEAARQIRSRLAGKTPPIIALTAHAMKGEREKCIEAGCDDYLTKPIDKRRLLERVARWAQPSLVSAEDVGR